jgi:hypothetical protein
MTSKAASEPIRESSASDRLQTFCDAPATDPTTKELEACVAKFEADLGEEIREFLAANPDHIGCRLVRSLGLSTALEKRKCALFVRDKLNLDGADSTVAQLHRKMQIAIDETIASGERHYFSKGKPKVIKGEEVLLCLRTGRRVLPKTDSELRKFDRLIELFENRFGALFEKRIGRRMAW